MVYLYAGLGVVMLSGIMAIFEMGLSLMGQSMLPTPPDAYRESSEMKLVEKRMIGLLKDRNAVAQGLANQALCDALLQSYAAQYPGESAGQVSPMAGCPSIRGGGSAVANSTVAHIEF